MQKLTDAVISNYKLSIYIERNKKIMKGKPSQWEAVLKSDYFAEYTRNSNNSNEQKREGSSSPFSLSSGLWYGTPGNPKSLHREMQQWNRAVDTADCSGWFRCQPPSPPHREERRQLNSELRAAAGGLCLAAPIARVRCTIHQVGRRSGT